METHGIETFRKLTKQTLQTKPKGISRLAKAKFHL